MVKHLLNCSVHVAAAAFCQGAAVSSTNASSFTGGWAVRDMQTLMLIEQCESGQVGDGQPGEWISGKVHSQDQSARSTPSTKVLSRGNQLAKRNQLIIKVFYDSSDWSGRRS
jgi:hypothetical protein